MSKLRFQEKEKKSGQQLRHEIREKDIYLQWREEEAKLKDDELN